MFGGVFGFCWSESVGSVCERRMVCHTIEGGGRRYI